MVGYGKEPPTFPGDTLCRATHYVAIPGNFIGGEHSGEGQWIEVGHGVGGYGFG